MPEEPFVPPPSPYIVREFNDRGTLWLLEDPAFLRDLIRLLDPQLAESLDFSRAERINRSFIPADLQKQESDLIFRIPYRDGETEVLVYLLLEQQTQPDATMAYRLYSYCGELWAIQVREWKDTNAPVERRRLHPVVPIVFYTGDDRWTEPIALAGMMDLPAALQRFVPSWETLFLDLKKTPPEALTQLASALGWALRVLQVEKEPLPQIERVLQEAMQGIEPLPGEQAGQWQRCAWFLLQLVFHRRTGTEAQTLMRTVVEDARQSKFREGNEEVAMQSYAEFLDEKGQLKGERRMLLRQATSRFGQPDEQTLAKLEAIESPEVLERLGLRLLEVETWQELLNEV